MDKFSEGDEVIFCNGAPVCSEVDGTELVILGPSRDGLSGKEYPNETGY